MSRSHDPDFWQVTPLESFPPIEKWDDWAEFDATAWPRKVEKRYTLVPTTCFNCEAACGLVAYVDKETREIRKLEGNPFHPGSRGKNCAKGAGRATAHVECRKDKDVIDETPGAYKPIDAVMEAKKDLAEIVHTLRQVVCVKG
jgi:hypothetical protein